MHHVQKKTTCVQDGSQEYQRILIKNYKRYNFQALEISGKLQPYTPEIVKFGSCELGAK